MDYGLAILVFILVGMLFFALGYVAGISAENWKTRQDGHQKKWWKKKKSKS